MSFLETNDGFISQDKIIRIFWRDRDDEKHWDVEYLAGSEVRVTTVYDMFLKSIGFTVEGDGSVDYPGT